MLRPTGSAAVQSAESSSIYSDSGPSASYDSSFIDDDSYMPSTSEGSDESEILVQVPASFLYRADSHLEVVV